MVLTNQGKALFTRSVYKRGTFVEVYGYDYIPQSPLLGALAFAINRVLKKSLSFLEKIHVTSASPICSCGSPTLFLEAEKPICADHGYVVTSHTMLVHSVPLNPSVWQPKMINYRGEFTEQRRMSPRKFFALTPDQRFSFLAYVEDEETSEIFQEALLMLCSEVNGKKGVGLGMGWGKKFWGLFKAKITKWTKVSAAPKVGRNVIARLQSPFTTPGGKTYLAQTVKPLNVVTANTIVRNVHSRNERSIVSIFSEGSEVLVLEDVNYYPTGEKDWLIGFSPKVYSRRIGNQWVKAIEPSYLVKKKKERKE